MNKIVQLSKHAFFCLLFLMISSLGYQAKSQCLPTFSSACTSDDYINNFSTTGGVQNISNLASGCNGVLPNNTTYFSSMTVSGGVGKQLTFQFNLEQPGIKASEFGLTGIITTHSNPLSRFGLRLLHQL